MQLSIIDQNDSMNQTTREFAERRLRFALSRFSNKIDLVTVVVRDVNGPRGGVDKFCRITVKMRRLANVRITSQDAAVEPCLARAADRVGRAVARAVERSHHFDRRRPFTA
jgi:hypothetical protein